MKTLMYLVAIAILLGGVALVVTDFPMIEARFPAAGPALIGFGLILNLALLYIGRRKI